MGGWGYLGGLGEGLEGFGGLAAPHGHLLALGQQRRQLLVAVQVRHQLRLQLVLWESGDLE